MIIEDKYWEYALNSINQAKKEKRKYNGWKDKPDRVCFYSGVSGAERHEIFYGKGVREISLQLGFQIDLRSDFHREIHEGSDKYWQDEEKKWQYVYQRVYMDCLEGEGYTEAEALRAWMHLMHQNYIDELMPE